MNLACKLKALRKQFHLSQEQLAEKLNVSRQAITKWETGGGTPDLENLLALSALFHVTVDELLTGKDNGPQPERFSCESVTEYDMDFEKHYDLHLGGAYEVVVRGTDREKLKLRLASNILDSLEHDFKVKLDDQKRHIDIDLRRSAQVTEAQAKEGLSILIELPIRLLADVELSAITKSLSIEHLSCENLEFDGKVPLVHLMDVAGHVELNCSTDMEIFCDKLNGRIDVNQISATSTLHLPQGSSFFAKRPGRSNRISYTVDGQPAEDFSAPGSTNRVELNGMNAELIINACKNPLEES